jgi:hypothetical protein
MVNGMGVSVCVLEREEGEEERREIRIRIEDHKRAK